jgi:hypothetical protein
VQIFCNSHGFARANQSEEEPMTLAEPRSSGQDKAGRLSQVKPGLDWPGLKRPKAHRSTVFLLCEWLRFGS